MRLFIRVKNGSPYEHPIFEDNFRQAFPNVDVNNLTPDFVEFVRVEHPVLGAYEVYEGVTYEKIGNFYQDVHHVRPMTLEEKSAKQNAIKAQWAAFNFAPSWVFDEMVCQFIPPIKMPDDGRSYVWDETTVSWVEVTS